MHHSRQGEVVDVHVATGALVWYVRTRKRFADNGVGCGRHQRGFRIDLDGEPLVADQCPDPNPGATRQRAHLAVEDGELGGRAAESRRPEIEQRAPRRGRRLTHLHAAARQSGASAGSTLIGTAARVAVTRSAETPSSSAAICATAMRKPVPTSTFPL